MITTLEAAKILGVTRQRVNALIAAGRLRASKIGRDNLIQRSDLEAVKDRRPGTPGWQTKKKMRRIVAGAPKIAGRGKARAND